MSVPVCLRHHPDAKLKHPMSSSSFPKPFILVTLILSFTGAFSCQSLPAQAEGALHVVPERPRLFVTPKRLASIQANARGKLSRVYLDRVKKDCDLTYDEKRIQDTISNPGYLLARTLSFLLCSRIEEHGGPYRDKALALADAIIKDGRGETRRENRIRL